MSELLERQQELSIQPRSESSSRGFSMHLLDGLVASGQLAPAWWSPSRDAFLRRFITQSDHVSSAINSMCARLSAIPSHIEARDPTVKAHRKLADLYNIIWNETSDFGRGKSDLIFKYARDWYGQDNGCFLEIIGDGQKDGPIEGPAVGIANLDAAKCSRTGDPTYPVVYDAGNDGKYRLHYTRVAFASSMPSNREDMYNVGYCAVSRCLNNAQRLIDQDVYYQEKMGSRPKRQILITQGGLDPDDVSMAFRMADRSMDNQQLSRFSKAVLLGDSTIPDGNIISVDLASIPDGFDQQTSTTLGMFAIAMAFGVPVRWLWPASSAGATKADAMFQHIAGQGPGVGQFLAVLTNLLGGDPRGDLHLTGKFLPPTLRLVFDFQDDDQDRQVAENKKVRVEGWEKHLQNQTMDVRTVREQMLRAGDLTDDQFRRLELENGRLPEGRDVLSLFSDTSPLMLQLLDLNVTNPLAIEANDPADMILETNAAALEAQDMIVNAPSNKQKQEAELALAALGKLKSIYEQILTEEIQQEQLAEQERLAQEEGKPIPAEEPKDETPEDETKQFNFGASVGEIIRGKLARGAGGKFVNVEDLKAKLQQDILNRLRSRQGAEGLTAAELKRLQNREAVLELLGGKISAENLDALAGLRAGEQPDQETAQALQKAGLAEITDDGTVIMSSAGRGVVRAANSGDVDGVLGALERAKPKPKGGKGGAPKATAADRARERERLKREETELNREEVKDSIDLDLNDTDALFAFSDGQDLPEEVANRAAKNGLVTMDSAGNYRFTTEGNAFVRAADKGDIRGAQDAISKGRDKVAGASEASQARDERQETNRDKIRGTVSIATDDVNAILDFDAGNEIEPETAKRIAQQGLAEFDASGNLRFTTVGRTFVDAANSGDVRRAQDAISRGNDAVDRNRKRIEDRERLLTENLDNADTHEQSALAMQSDIDRLIENANTRDRQSAESGDVLEAEMLRQDAQRYRDQAQSAMEQQERMLGRADSLRERAQRLTNEIQRIMLQIGEGSVKSLGMLFKDGRKDLQLEIRAAMRQLWAGLSDPFDFVDEMVSILKRLLLKAAYEGGEECGIKQDEWTDDERKQIIQSINGLFVYLPRLARYIVSVREQAIQDGKTPNLRNMPVELFVRAELWVNRYDQFKNDGKAIVCENQKLEWTLGETEHCPSCIKLDGTVKRASEWKESGIIPRVPGADYLECKGYRCACNLVPTDKPMSKGPFPRLP